MIVCESRTADFLTDFSDGVHHALADAGPEHAGSGAGFRPHDLLEAALANCLVIVGRMYAKKRAIPLTGMTARVTLNRDDPARAVFEYQVEFKGEITDEQRAVLLRAISACPVRKTLLRQIEFKSL